MCFLTLKLQSHDIFCAVENMMMMLLLSLNSTHVKSDLKEVLIAISLKCFT